MHVSSVPELHGVHDVGSLDACGHLVLQSWTPSGSVHHLESWGHGIQLLGQAQNVRILNPLPYFGWLSNVIGKIGGVWSFQLESAISNLVSFPEAWMGESFLFPVLDLT